MPSSGSRGFLAASGAAVRSMANTLTLLSSRAWPLAVGKLHMGLVFCWFLHEWYVFYDVRTIIHIGMFYILPSASFCRGPYTSGLVGLLGRKCFQAVDTYLTIMTHIALIRMRALDNAMRDFTMTRFGGRCLPKSVVQVIALLHEQEVISSSPVTTSTPRRHRKRQHQRS